MDNLRIVKKPEWNYAKYTGKFVYWVEEYRPAMDQYLKFGILPAQKVINRWDGICYFNTKEEAQVFIDEYRKCPIVYDSNASR